KIAGETSGSKEAFRRNRRQSESHRQDSRKVFWPPFGRRNRVGQKRQARASGTSRLHFFLSRWRRGFNAGRKRRQTAHSKGTGQGKRTYPQAHRRSAKTAGQERGQRGKEEGTRGKKQGRRSGH